GRALELMENPLIAPDQLTKSDLESVIRRGEFADLLAEDYTGSGVASRAFGSSRGLRINGIVPPITFEFGTTDLTPKGRVALEDVFSRIEGEDVIVIHGHTDPRGSAEENQRLSERRAARVARELGVRGYSGEILTVGHGESRPVVIQNRDYYDDQAVCQILRRVEIGLT